MSKKVLVVDIETTGLNPEIHDIVEIGIAEVNLSKGKITKVFDKVIKNKGELNEFAWVFENTTLKPEMVLNAEPIENYFRMLYSLLVNNWVTAYNVAFDSKFLRRYGFDLPYIAPDPMIIASESLKIPYWNGGYKFPKFEEAYHHYLEKDFVEAHRAYDDAEAEARLILKMFEKGEFTLNGKGRA